MRSKSVEELKDGKYLSVGAYTVCILANLNTSDNIISYYLENRTFSNIRNCGATKDNELIKFCRSHLEKEKFDFTDEILKEIKLTTSTNQLKNIHYISKRAHTVCQKGQLFNVSEILDFYALFESFLSIDLCGKTTNDELISLSRSLAYLKIENNQLEKSATVQLSNSTTVERNIFANLSPTKIDTLSVKFDVLWNNLPIRIKNAYRKFTNRLELSYYLENQTAINRTLSQQAGVGSIQELIRMYDELKEYAIYLEPLSENEVVYLYNKSFINSKFGHHFHDYENLFDSNKSILIFRFIDILINESILEKARYIDNREQYLLKNHCLYYTNSIHSTLDQLAQSWNITRERARQIRSNFFTKGFNLSFDFVKNIKTKLIENLRIDAQTDLGYISPELTHQINKSEETQFSSLFITKIIVLLLSETHTLVGDELEIHKLYKSQSEASLKNLYIITKEVNQYFSVNDFLNNISSRLSDRIKETYKIPVRGLLAKYIEGEGKWEATERLVPLAETLLYEEFSLVVQNGDIQFERNSRSNDYEYAKEALESLPPSPAGYHVNIILERIHELYPNQEEFNTSSLISAMQRERTIFGAIGRQSTYILRSWEKFVPNTKAGTIRDIVEEYLLQFDEVKNISEIADYVRQKRPNTYEMSIVRNLQADTSGRFNVISDTWIGLKKKSYTLSEEVIIKRPTFFERTADLQLFIQTNGRRPLASTSLKEEKRLYSFMHKYFKQIRRQSIDPVKIKRWIKLGLPMP